MTIWLTVEDIAERLKVKPRTVRGWIQDERLPARNIGGRAGWRVRQEDFDEFMAGLKSNQDGGESSPLHLDSRT